MAASDEKGVVPPMMGDEEEEEKYEIVRPSETYSIDKKREDTFLQPMVFQTPILPCFTSEFQSRNQLKTEGNKHIQEGEGVWRIGKMRVKGDKC